MIYVSSQLTFKKVTYKQSQIDFSFTLVKLFVFMLLERNWYKGKDKKK